MTCRPHGSRPVFSTKSNQRPFLLFEIDPSRHKARAAAPLRDGRTGRAAGSAHRRDRGREGCFCWRRGSCPHGRHQLRYAFRPPPRAWKLLRASHFGIFLGLSIRDACQGSPSRETPCSQAHRPDSEKRGSWSNTSKWI